MEIKMSFRKFIMLIIAILAIIIILALLFYNKDKVSQKVANNQNNIIQNNITQNVLDEAPTKDLSGYSFWELEEMQKNEEIEEDVLTEKFKEEFNRDENSIHYSLIKKYNYDEEIFMKYYSYGVEWGDLPNYSIIECNYKENPLKYEKPIIFTMAMVKDYLYSSDEIDTKELKKFKKALLEERRHFAELTGDNSYITEELYEALNGMSIRNGNCENEEAYKNNSRAKKFKVIINNTEEHIFELEDNMEVQLFDLGYKQYDIGVPMTVKLEVLEVYEGLVSNDIYINEIGFGFTSYGFGGR